MGYAEILHSFWSSFGWTAYDENTVPSSEQNPAMPRITYSVAQDDFDGSCMLTASLWDRSYSWAAVEQKAKEISEHIGMGGVVVDSTIWITKGSPFIQRMSDEDDTIRRIVILINAETLR